MQHSSNTQQANSNNNNICSPLRGTWAHVEALDQAALAQIVQGRRRRAAESTHFAVNSRELSDFQEVILAEKDSKVTMALVRMVSNCRAVVRLEFADEGKWYCGSGVLVSPWLLLTARHNLPSQSVAATCSIHFDVDGDPSKAHRHPVPLDPEVFFVENEVLDFALVKVAWSSPLSAAHKAISKRCGWSELINDPLLRRKRAGDSGTRLVIIQHPGGTVTRPKEVSFVGELKEEKDPNFTYTNDTEAGSSGSPVFNFGLEMIGLHHGWVERRNSTGAIMNKQGVEWKEEDGEDQVAYYNEGTMITSICSYLLDFVTEVTQFPASCPNVRFLHDALGKKR